MKYVLKFIGVMSLMFLTFNIFAADILAKVDRSDIKMGETFNLIITVAGQSQARPDYSPLNRYFEILGQAQTNQINVSNGVTEAKTVFVVQLEAKKLGKLTIPSITVGNQQTKPLIIQVSTNANSTTSADNKSLFLKANVSTTSPYVQGQVIYTAKLFATSQIANNWQSARLTPPAAENAVVKQLGKFTYYNTTIDGKTYQVAEIRYAIFPQQSGSLKISPVEFHGNMLVMLNNSNNNVFGSDAQFFSSGLKPFTAVAPAITLNVKPIPANFNGKTWLPAKNITLSDSWSSHPQQIKVGSPITRTIILHATGLTSSQLPNITVGKVENMNTYPDLPTSQTSNTSSNIVSKRIEKIAYVPTKAGNITIPAITLSWWNTTTSQLQTATLPAYTLTVVGGGEANNSPNTIPSTANNSQTISPAKPKVVTEVINKRNYLPWILSCIFFLLWIVTFVLLKNRKPKALSDKDVMLDIVSLRASRQAVKRACRSNDPLMLKESLLAWAAMRFQVKHVISLGQICDRIKDEDLKMAIKRLDFVLYSDGKSTWDGKSFWKIFINYIHHNKIKTKKNKKQVLPSLYPK